MIANEERHAEDRRHDTVDPVETTETVPTEHGPEEPGARSDVVSDPALDDRLGSDWSDEGGAAPTGPATDADPPE